MTNLTDLIEKNGKLIELNNNTPFQLEGENCWYIKKGAVDIFVVEFEDTTIIQRIHLTRIEQNYALFSLSIKQPNHRIRFVAVGIPETQVVQLTHDKLTHLFNQKEYLPQFVEWVNHWLRKLANELLNLYQPPKDYVPLTPFEKIELKNNEFAVTLKDVVWITHSNNSIQWFDRVIDNSHLNNYGFPIPQGTWLQAKGEVKLSCIDTLTCINENKLLPKLTYFHEEIFPCILQICEQYKKNEIDHLQKKDIYISHDLDRTLEQLTSVVKTKTATKVIGETGNALFDACQIVVKTVGVRLQPPPHLTKDSNISLNDIVRHSRLMMRPVSLSSTKWWKQDNGPILAFTVDNLPVALLPRNEKSYYLLDTTNNSKVIVTDEIAATLQPTAIIFFHTLSANKISLSELIHFGLYNSYHDIIRLVLYGILSGLLAIAIPYSTDILFNQIIPADEKNLLLQIIVILIIISFVIGIFHMANAIALLRVEGKAKLTIQPAMIERLFNLPASFFRDYSSGDLAQRVFAVDNIMEIVTGTTQTTILTGIFSLFSWLYMFFINIELALLATFLIFVALFIFVYLNYHRLRFERQISELQGMVLNRVYQLLNGVVKIRIAGAEIQAFVQWAAKFKDRVEATINANKIMNYLLVFNSVFIMTASIILFGFIALKNINLATGSFVAFYTAFTQFSLAILGMSAALTTSLNAIPLYERAKPILQTLPEVDATKIEPGELRGHIEVTHLAFQYHKDTPNILEDINFQVQPGQFIALVGPSSAGKSTIMRLLLGLEKPNSGAIYYDGKNLAELNLQEVRRQIGVVIQNAKLLPGTIFSNIVGSSQATLKDAWEAARLAGFDNDIKAMPMEMNTFISEGVGTISGGQRQRLLIARAIVNKPKILLFDEASSALDNITQAVVSKSLQELSATRIIIAHRLSTIMHADLILVVDNGRIVESGKFEELMQMNGSFALLAKRQMIT